MKLLIADDNEDIRDILGTFAEGAGYQVVTAANGKDALTRFRAGGISLILLDVMMPEMDGFQVCREIRRESDVPIIMITARGEDYDRIMGLDIGADDYVVKPFSVAEVMARVKAVLRRLPRENATQGISIGNLRLDEEIGETEISGVPLSLTRKEYDILCLLLRNKGRIFSRNELLDRLWGCDYMGDTRTVDTHMRRLRAKLDGAGAKGFSIDTVWGRGYHLTEGEQ